MKKVYLLFLVVMFCGQAMADDIETKLYKSCMTANENSQAVAPMCTCQTKMWASGTLKNPTDPSKTFEIKKEYIDNLIANWNYDIGVKNGAKLEGKNGEMAGIAMIIGFTCAKELGALK